MLNPLSPTQQPQGGDGVAETRVAANPAPDPAYVAKATKASIEFESFFVGQMLHQMRSTTRELAAEDSVFKDKVNADMQDMADNLLAGQIAGQRAFGIADAILRQLLPAPLNKTK
jgi:flagellar protein FlgJ